MHDTFGGNADGIFKHNNRTLPTTALSALEKTKLTLYNGKELEIYII